MRRFTVVYRNGMGATIGVLKLGVTLSELGNLPAHVRQLGDKAFAGQWAEARVQGLNLVVTSTV